jgi:hypothetical protein
MSGRPSLRFEFGGQKRIRDEMPKRGGGKNEAVGEAVGVVRSVPVSSSSAIRSAARPAHPARSYSDASTEAGSSVGDAT